MLLYFSPMSIKGLLQMFPLLVKPPIFAATFFFAMANQLSVATTCEPEWINDGVGNPGIGFNFFSVYTLQSFHTSTESLLVAGGNFVTDINGESIQHIAAWDGTEWNKLGGSANFSVRDFAVQDFGGGAELYAAGRFTEIGGTSANYLARWDGSSWNALGSEVTGRVEALYSTTLDGEPVLVAGGRFTFAGPHAVGRVAVWNGTEWSPLGYGADDHVRAIGEFHDAKTGSRHLIIGGRFRNADGNVASGAAFWNGNEWAALPSSRNLFDSANGHQVWEFENSQPEAPEVDRTLYLGGWVTDSAPPPINNVFSIDQTFISNLGGGTSNTVDALLATSMFSSEETLYVGGGFIQAGPIASGPIAKWNGNTWESLGGELRFFDNFGWVEDIATFDDGSATGPAIYVSGHFNSAAGFTAYGIAKYGCPEGPGLIFRSSFEELPR